MLDPKKVDFKKLGFHAGIEVHHQIRSDRKLFCQCPPTLENDPRSMDYTFFRYFRPVLGEMGDFDPGMLVEFEKGYKVIYYACERNTCTYEMDETPPFWPDDETIDIGYHLAALFKCESPVEEIVVNRKQYLDGSITTGFQRSMIIARDGYVELKDGKRIIFENENYVVWSPYWARFPYECWIVPKEHEPSFSNIAGTRVKTLAGTLRSLLFKIAFHLGAPAYNFYIHSAPCDGKEYPEFHWHLEVIPRTTRTAGFEEASGFYINPVTPEKAAEVLRRPLVSEE